MAAIAQTLASIVGATGVQAWADLDPQWQQQIQAAVPPGPGGYWVAPQTQAELAAVMGCAALHHWRVLPCGNGSKLHWGGLAADVNLVISTQRLHQVIDHAIGDLTVTAEVGIKLADLQTTVGAAGQFLAVDPSYADRATLGGVIATGDTGSQRQRYNSVRDMLLGITFVRHDGEVVKAGGRVVKNVAGYDLMKLLTGSYGTLGILTQATMRVYPQPEAAQTIVLAGSPDRLGSAHRALLNSALTPAAIAWVSASAMTDLGLERQLGLIVRFQSMAASVEQQTAMLLELGQTLGLAALTYPEATEAALWQQLAQLARLAQPDAAQPDVIACKIGVQPAEAVAFLSQLEALVGQARTIIQAGSGLGWLILPVDTPASLMQTIRSHCLTAGGYLSMLQAPIRLKQQVEVWGYAGNALTLMKKVKQQFDPENRLSPGRFVGGI